VGTARRDGKPHPGVDRLPARPRQARRRRARSCSDGLRRLYAYSNDPNFDLRVVSLLDALRVRHRPHPRRRRARQDWYEDGRLLPQKKPSAISSTSPIFSCARAMRARGKCSPKVPRLGPAVAPSQPGRQPLPRISLRVPFVDAVTTMLDETIPLTANEWTQWAIRA